MKLFPLNYTYIDEVIDNLGEPSILEAEAFDLELKDLKEKMWKFVNKPFQAAFCNDDGNAFALAALEVKGKGKWKSYFLVSKDITKKDWHEFTKFWKNCSSRIIGHEGEIELETALAHGNGFIHKWYKSLGFEWAGRFTDKTSIYLKHGGTECALAVNNGSSSVNNREYRVCI